MTQLFRLLARVPLPWMHRIGAWLGWLVYWLSPTYRGRVRANAGNAGFTPAQYRPAIGAAGAMVAELPWLWLRPAGESVLQRVRWHDEQVFEQALAARRGVQVTIAIPARSNHPLTDFVRSRAMRDLAPAGVT